MEIYAGIKSKNFRIKKCNMEKLWEKKGFEKYGTKKIHTQLIKKRNKQLHLLNNCN